MDPSAFDTLARAIAQTGTRRRVLRRLVASLPLLAVPWPRLGQEAAAEQPHRAAAAAHPAAQP